MCHKAVYLQYAFGRAKTIEKYLSLLCQSVRFSVRFLSAQGMCYVESICARFLITPKTVHSVLLFFDPFEPED